MISIYVLRRLEDAHKVLKEWISFRADLEKVRNVNGDQLIRFGTVWQRLESNLTGKWYTSL